MSERSRSGRGAADVTGTRDLFRRKRGAEDRLDPAALDRRAGGDARGAARGDELTPQPRVWPRCSDCKTSYVLRHSVIFVACGRRMKLSHEWVWQRDCTHKRAAPEVGCAHTPRVRSTEPAGAEMTGVAEVAEVSRPAARAARAASAARAARPARPRRR